MAVTKVSTNSALKLELQTGVDDGGSPVYRTRSLNNVKATAADQDIFDVAAALADLQEYTLTGVGRQDNASLVSE